MLQQQPRRLRHRLQALSPKLHEPRPLHPRREPFVCKNLTDSIVDMRFGELVLRTHSSASKFASSDEEYFQLSQAFRDFFACSSDISGELKWLTSLSPSKNTMTSELSEAMLEPEPCQGFLQRENFSTEIIESISPEDLQPTIKICVDGLQSPSLAVKQSAAAKLRLLANNRVDNRALIGKSGAFLALIALLRCSDPWTQEHAVTAHTQFAKFQLGFEQGRKKRMDARGKDVKGVAIEHTQFAKFQLGFDLFE